jgi:Protein of unknown function (DUF2997)
MSTGLELMPLALALIAAKAAGTAVAVGTSGALAAALGGTGTNAPAVHAVPTRMRDGRRLAQALATVGTPVDGGSSVLMANVSGAIVAFGQAPDGTYTAAALASLPTAALRQAAARVEAAYVGQVRTDVLGRIQRAAAVHGMDAGPVRQEADGSWVITLRQPATLLLQGFHARLRPDGSIHAETFGLKGTECLPYVELLPRITNAEVVDSRFTADYYTSADNSDEEDITTTRTTWEQQ